jgi:hypothetical protein
MKGSDSPPSGSRLAGRSLQPPNPMQSAAMISKTIRSENDGSGDLRSALMQVSPSGSLRERTAFSEFA